MKLKIIIKGRVHGVGYRVKLINIALEYGIDKFNVFNTFIDGKQAVICLVEAPDDIIDILKQKVKTEKPEKAIVESIEFEDYRYEIPPIERCMQAFQMEHWGKAIPILLDMLEKQELMLEKQDEMLKKQDETIKEIREVKETVKEESEKTRDELGGKIDLLRSNLREYMEWNLKRIYDEIAEIKEALKRAGIM